MGVLTESKSEIAPVSKMCPQSFVMSALKPKLWSVLDICGKVFAKNRINAGVRPDIQTRVGMK